METQHSFPSARTLFIVWLVLMGLTLATMIFGRVSGAGSLGLLLMAVLMTVTWFKSRLILLYYLDLRSADGIWRGFFGAFIMIVVFVVFGLYALGQAD